MMQFEQIVISDAELKASIENKLNQSLSVNSNVNIAYHFDQLSTFDTLGAVRKSYDQSFASEMSTGQPVLS
jgi:hypothetical protein